jgi:DNA-binding protein H-NS
MELTELTGTVKRMLEEEKEGLEQCLKKRRTTEEQQEARRAEKLEDMKFFRDAVIEMQAALNALKAVRTNDGKPQNDPAVGCM